MVTFPKKSQKLGSVEFLLEPQFPFLLEERMETKNVKLIMMIIMDIVMVIMKMMTPKTITMMMIVMVEPLMLIPNFSPNCC